MIISVAVALAVVDAVCFGVAAVLQHRGVGRTLAAGHGKSGERRLDLAAFTRLVAHPIWLAGTGFIVVGTALHVTALFLAPVSLIQPIGVLAIPVAVLLTTKKARRSIGRGVVGGIALCVIGTASFVWLAASRVASTPITGADLGVASAVLLVVVLVLAVVGQAATRWRRCLAYAAAGAVSFGFVSALMRALSQHLDGQLGRLVDPIALALLACLLVAVAVGAWCVQQAYASGQPAVVMACLTVVDPVVAVLLGVVLLGEGAAVGPGTATAMVGAGLVAAIGVATLSSHHPEAQAGPHRGPGPDGALQHHDQSSPQDPHHSDDRNAAEIDFLPTHESLPERSARYEDHARR